MGQSGPGRHSDHLQRRRRNPDFAQARDHGPTRDYEVQLRKRLRERFPDTAFFFQPANITTQILNFGLPAPIDLQVVGRDADGQLQDRPEARREDCAHSRSRRRSRSPGGRPAGNPPERGSSQGVAIGFDAARRHQQHADLSERQRPGGAELLGELGQRRELQRGRADASIPHRFPGCPAPHPRIGGDQRRQYHHTGFASRRVRRPAMLSSAPLPAALRRPTEIPGAMAGSTQLLSNLVTVQRGYCAGDRQPL